MKRYIHVTKTVREHLIKAFGATNTMVWYALTYHPTRGDSYLAKRIRCAALKNGGIIMNELPEMECFHDYDDYMRQYFPNGAMIELNKKNDVGDVLFNGVSVRRYTDVRVDGIKDIQAFASALK